MAMKDHLTNGSVTPDTIRDTAADMVAEARAGQLEAQGRGDAYTADLFGEAVNVHLDRMSGGR